MADDKGKWKISVPHTFILIGIIVVIATVMTYIVPAGEFDRIEDPNTGRTIVVPDSFHSVEQSPVGIFQMFIAIQKGMMDAADIIFFVFFAYGLVYMLVKTGAFNGAVGALLRKIEGKEKFMIPVFMLFFGICGATFGMYEETYGFVPVFMGIAVALGYDALVGAVIVFVGVATGFASAITNPFTIGVAQGIAELPMFSGIGLRIVIWIAFMSLVIWYVMRYAAKVKANPACSLVGDVKFPMIASMKREELLETPFTSRHKLSILLFALTIFLVVFGTIKYGWYIEELSGLFILMMVVIGLASGLNFSQIAEAFVEACSNVVFGALVIGISRTVLIVMQDGCIIDTVVYYLASSVANLSAGIAAAGMVVVQNLINFFIPSGSGQAATSMPIMTPLADLIGLKRQIAVLAFQFGDGFSNLFWPTAVATECGIAGIPIDRWYKFMGPLFVLMLILEFIFIGVAVAIGYGPF
jgi:uncharacterized ion transporter superfamily protein YfcC